LQRTSQGNLSVGAVYRLARDAKTATAMQRFLSATVLGGKRLTGDQSPRNALGLKRPSAA